MNIFIEILIYALVFVLGTVVGYSNGYHFGQKEQENEDEDDFWYDYDEHIDEPKILEEFLNMDKDEPFNVGDKVVIKSKDSFPLAGYKKGDTAVYKGNGWFVMFDDIPQVVDCNYRKSEIFELYTEPVKQPKKKAVKKVAKKVSKKSK